MQELPDKPKIANTSGMTVYPVPLSTNGYMEIELNIFKDSIHRILTDHLRLRKVWAE